MGELRVRERWEEGGKSDVWRVWSTIDQTLLGVCQNHMIGAIFAPIKCPRNIRHWLTCNSLCCGGSRAIHSGELCKLTSESLPYSYTNLSYLDLHAPLGASFWHFSHIWYHPECIFSHVHFFLPFPSLIHFYSIFRLIYYKHACFQAPAPLG